MDKLMTYKECADYLRISVNTLYSWTQRGLVPSIQISRRCTRFDRAAIEKWVADRAAGGEVANG